MAAFSCPVITISLSCLGLQAETANAHLLCTASFYMELERLSVCNLIMYVSRCIFSDALN